MNVHSLPRQGVTVRVHTNATRKLHCPAFSWFSLCIFVCSPSPAGKHPSEESHRNQPENSLSPSSLRQHPEFTKWIHTTLLTEPYGRAILWATRSLTRKEAADLGLKCFPSAVPITLEHLYTLYVLNAAQASSISQLQIKVDKCTKPQTNRKTHTHL